MTCPFLEEVLVRYCKAYPIKKMIPCTGFDTPALCESEEYINCSEYREVAKINQDIPKEVKKVNTQKPQRIPGGERECIWMKAGVISYRLCTLNYDCNSCEFFQSLMDTNQRYAESPEIFDLIQRLRNLPAHQRKCRYMLMGEVHFKLCSNNYQCGTCEYDQVRQDAIDQHPLIIAKRVKSRRFKAREFFIREDFYFYPRHTWVRKDRAGRVKIGLDDFAQKLIGNPTKVAVPAEGSEVKRGEGSWEIRCGSRRAKLLSPIDGMVTDVNRDLIENPSLLNQDPYGRGWVLTVNPTNLEDDLKALLKGNEAKSWLEEEVNKLHHKIEDELGVTITDGGDPLHNLPKFVNDAEWESFVKDFLTL